MSENGPLKTTDQLSPRGRIAVAAVCLATGAGIAALAAGIIPSDESNFHAPHWVVGACGFVFMLAGVMILVPASAPRLQSFLGAVFLSVFAAVPAWVAFGPGPRAFSGSVSFGALTSATHPGATTGRIVFGIGAVLVGALAAYAWVRWVRSLFGPRDDAREPTR